MSQKEKYREAFNGAFEALGEPARRERVERYRLFKTAEFIEAHAGGYRGKRVLELGSSLGVHLIATRRLGSSHAVGLDYFVFPDTHENDFYVHDEAFSHLMDVWRAEGVEVLKHHLKDRFPFENDSFDLVVCNAVIEHLHGIHRHVFQEAHRVLAENGTFVFTTPNIASALKRTRFVIGRSPNWDIKDYFKQGENFTGHVREFTVKECELMLRDAGFTSTHVEAKPGYFKWRWIKNPRKWHMFFFQALARPFRTLGDLIYAAGRK